MLIAVAAYNLKKLLKYAKTPPKSVAQRIKAANPLAMLKNGLTTLILIQYKPLNYLVIKTTM
jgi:hypothetical protein